MKQLFRQSVIDKLTSPDQLDRSIIIISPMSWISLLGVSVIILSSLIWAFFGKMPENITAPGIISSGTETGAIYADTAGTIESILVLPGDIVSKDTPLCTLTDSAGTEHLISASQNCTIMTVHIKSGMEIRQNQPLFGAAPADRNASYLVCYLPYQEAQRLSPGMPVKFIPEGVNRQSCGQMEGAVAFVDSSASSSQQIETVLGNNPAVLQYFIPADLPVCAVSCIIREDSSSKNGFFWTGRAGRNLNLSPHAVGRLSIVISEKPPISKLLPEY